MELEKQTERHKGRLGGTGKEARESGRRRKSTPNSNINTTENLIHQDVCDTLKFYSHYRK